MRIPRLLRLILTALAVGAATACSSNPFIIDTPEPVMLPEPYASRVPLVEPPPRPEEIFALTAEMRSYLRSQLNPRQSKYTLVRELSDLVLHPGSLGVSYDGRQTRTAPETFRYRTGNCLSLSILFVVMARELGIDARFQEVEVAPQWDRRGDVIFSTRHVNVLGRLHPHGEYVMDFYPFVARHKLGFEQLSDAEALGQFYNNLGGDYLAAGDLAAAYVYFVASIRTAPRVSYVWSNLGVLYQRVDYVLQAERMFRHSIRLDSSNTSAMNNLAALLQKSGRHLEANELMARLRRVREKNPYYFYALAQRAAEQGDDRKALSHLERAIRLKPEEILFYETAAETATRLEEGDLAEAYQASGAALDEARSSIRTPLRF